MLRRREVIGWFTLLLIVAGPSLLWGADLEAEKPKTPIAHLEIQPARVDWRPQVDYELILTVAGPEDFYIQREFAAGEIPSFSPNDISAGHLSDGVYAYELRAVPRPEQEPREKPVKSREVDGSVVNRPQNGVGLSEGSLVQSGHLWVQGGSFVAEAPVQPGPARPSKPEAKPPLRNPAAKTTVPDDLIVQGQACIGSQCVIGDADSPVLKLKEDGGSGLLQIKFDAINCCFPWEVEWFLQANEPGSSGDFLIRTGGLIPFRIGANAPDNAFTISSGNGNIGLGTLTPGADLHVFGNATNDTFGSAGPNPLSGPAFNFGYGGASFGRGAGFLNVQPDASATAPNPSLRFLTATVQRMIITNTGDVGIGTTSPAGALHVSRSTGEVATLARFSNDKGIQVLYDRTDAGANDWQTSNFNASFEISIPGSSPGQFNLASNGNLTISGTLTQGSSRELKTDFSSMNPKDVLSRVTALPVSSWSYKTESAVRHVGPMAEDFHKAFGLGVDDRHLAPSDQAGVALLAVQGLNQIVQEKGDEITTLRSENAELARRLAVLEALLSTMMNRGDAPGSIQLTPAEEH